MRKTLEAFKICFREATRREIVDECEKISFMKSELVYLGFVISNDGLKWTQKKEK